MTHRCAADRALVLSAWRAVTYPMTSNIAMTTLGSWFVVPVVQALGTEDQRCIAGDAQGGRQPDQPDAGP